MKRVFLSIFALLLTVAAAYCVPPGDTTVSPTGPLAATPPIVLNVMDFGGQCNYNPATNTGTDDSGAFNAMTAAGRAINANVEILQPIVFATPKQQFCLITNPVNLTGLTRPGVTVDFNEIHCSAAGKICLDGLSSRFISWHVTMKGDATAIPIVGIAHGRINGTASADNMNFIDLNLEGDYSIFSIYNYASELANYGGGYVYNRLATGGQALGLDGCGYFANVIQSTFVTNITPYLTRMPMGGVSAAGAKFENNGPQPPIWMGCTKGVSFQHTYVAAINPAAPACVALWANDAIGNEYPHLQIGCEKSTTEALLFTGPQAAQTINTLEFENTGMESTGSVFALDTGVTSANCLNCEVKISSTAASPLLFDNPANWKMNGHVLLPSLSMWNEPLSFTGDLCTPSGCTPYVPTPPLNRNADFLFDQINGALGSITIPVISGQLITDGWEVGVNGYSPGQFQLGPAYNTPPPGGIAYLSAASVAAVAPGSSYAYTVGSAIEGPDFGFTDWGTGGATPITLGFWAQATVAGTYNAYLQNNGATRSYIVDFAIAAANTWQYFHFLIPGDTGGAWSAQRNRVGLGFGFCLGSGAGYHTPPNVWTTGNFCGDAAGTALSATSGAKLLIGQVYVRGGQFFMPPLKRSLRDEIQSGLRYYEKSPKVSTLAAQNAGSAGAAEAVSPYAYASGLNVAIPVRFATQMFEGNDTLSPAITFYSPAAATANCYDATRSVDIGAASAVDVSDGGFTALCPLTAGVAAGDLIKVNWSAQASGI